VVKTLRDLKVSVKGVKIFAEKIDIMMNYLKTATFARYKADKNKSYHQTLTVGSNRVLFVIIVTRCL